MRHGSRLAVGLELILHFNPSIPPYFTEVAAEHHLVSFVRFSVKCLPAVLALPCPGHSSLEEKTKEADGESYAKHPEIRQIDCEACHRDESASEISPFTEELLPPCGSFDGGHSGAKGLAVFQAFPQC